MKNGPDIVPMVTSTFRGYEETIIYFVGIVIGNIRWLSAMTGAWAWGVMVLRMWMWWDGSPWGRFDPL